jgi:hypothetical protein
LQPIEGRSKRIGASAQALIRNASLDDFVLGVDEFPLPAFAVRQEAIEEVRGLVGQSARSDAGGSATTVTLAAQLLQSAGLIRYRRGHILILDRTALEELSCECYAIVRVYTDRIFPPSEGA